jgi:hypothetical protein
MRSPPKLRSELAEAVAEVRSQIWGRSAKTNGTGPVYLDYADLRIMPTFLRRSWPAVVTATELSA